jgi:adenosylcobyric acid synthase
VAKAILQAQQNGKAVYGICGGFQMMGNEIHDPMHIEGPIESIPGLGILPIKTVITEDKTTEQCQFTFLDENETCKGYEIHMGESVYDNGKVLNLLKNGKSDGYYLNAKTWGTYIHGIFDNQAVIKHILKHNAGLETNTIIDYKSFKEEQYDKLALHVRQNVDLGYIYGELAIGN